MSVKKIKRSKKPKIVDIQPKSDGVTVVFSVSHDQDVSDAQSHELAEEAVKKLGWHSKAVEEVEKEAKLGRCMVVLTAENEAELRCVKDALEQEFFSMVTEDQPCSQHAKEHHLAKDGAIITCVGGWGVSL